VIVTGGGSGLGFEIARAFGRAGGRVVISGRRKEMLERARDVLGEEGIEVLIEPGSVADVDDVRRLISRTTSELGPIDVVVNNAGVAPEAPLLETTDEQWDEVMDANLRGVFLVTREAARTMVGAGRGGVILMTSSINSIRPRSPGIPYSVSKVGVDALVKGFARELAPHHIRVCSVQPGFINTPMAWDYFPNREAFKAWQAEHAKKVPLGRHAQPEDIAPAFVFLASTAASYITGAHLLVDGGLLTVA
jgi:NAD(P)-dependent dehydrogenase (short-subunit alcohol dehydrogenase family)